MRRWGLHIVLIACMTAMMLSCEDRFLPEDKDIIVVEGWIDDGGFPVVIVTRSLPVRLKADGIMMDELSDYVEKWAKVTVSDGVNSVVLTGGKDSRYVPGYVYTTSYLRGEAGKSYTLTVETRGKSVRAVTTIPLNPPVVDSVVCRHLSSDTTVCEVMAYVRNNTSSREYFNSFYQEGADARQFLSSFLGVVDGGVADSVFTMPIIKGVSDYNKSDKTRYFANDTVVKLKISTMDDVSYEIWHSYEDNNRFRYMFMSASVREVASNIENGQGYWCGFNSFRLDFKAVPGTYPGNNL